MHFVHSKSPFCCSGVCLPGCGAVQIFDLGNSAHARDAREWERIARTMNGCGLLLMSVHANIIYPFLPALLCFYIVPFPARVRGESMAAGITAAAARLGDAA